MPAAGKLREAVAPVPSSNWASSSRSQARDAIVPSGSVEVSVNVTVWAVCGEDGETVNDAWGSWLTGGGGGSVTTTLRLATPLAPSSSVARTRTT